MADHEQNDSHRPFHSEGGAIIFDQPPSAEEARRQAREDEQHEFARAQVKTNRRIARFNGWLMLATLCTIGVGVWQAKISQRASNAAKSAADTAAQTLKELQTGQGATDTHTLAEQAKTQAQQTTALATAAGEQAEATRNAANSAVTQTDIARQSLHIGSDPILIVPSETMRRLDIYAVRLQPNRLSSQIEYTNIGRTPAISVVPTMTVDVQGGDSLPPIPLYDGLSGDVIAAGGVKSVSVSVFAGTTDMRQLQSVGSERSGISILGYIQYKDLFEKKHITAFCNFYLFNPGPGNTPRQCKRGNWFEHPQNSASPVTASQR